MMRLLVLLLVLFPSLRSLRAELPSWGSSPMRLEDCIQRALADEPTAQLLRARQLAAEALLQKARTLPNPVFAYTAQDIGVQTATGPALLHQLQISHPVLVSYLRTQEARVARAAREQAEAQIAEDRRQIRLAVGRAYFDAVLSERLVALEQQAVVAAAELVVQTQRRVQHGDIGTFDSDRAQAEQLDARRREEQAIRRSALARLSLSVLLGADEPFLVSVPAVFEESSEPTLEPAARIASARSVRPDLRAARAALAQAHEHERLEARRAIPIAELQVIGGVRIAAPGVGGLLALSLPLPLFDHNAGSRTAAAAQVQSARAAWTILERQVAAELLAAEREHQSASEALLRIARPQVSLRESTLRGARRLFAEGMASLLDVVAAQRDLLAAYRSLAEAEHDVALSAFRLRLMQGMQ